MCFFVEREEAPRSLHIGENTQPEELLPLSEALSGKKPLGESEVPLWLPWRRGGESHPREYQKRLGEGPFLSFAVSLALPEDAHILYACVRMGSFLGRVIREVGTACEALTAVSSIRKACAF